MNRSGLQLDPGQTFGDYRIEARVGEGGWGVVYRARDAVLDRTVALKLIRPEFADTAEARARFLRESQAAAAVQHPNIVPIYRAGDVDGQPFIAMLFVDGPDLHGLVAARGRLDEGSAVQVMSQVASALHSAHASGLVHRDVKPANVLVDDISSLHVYLTDFGIAKRISANTNLTATGLFVGTLDFIAPEQLEGDKVDARTDVYALGCMLFYVLAGRPPYVRDNELAVMFAHASADPPSLRDGPVPTLAETFDSVVQKAMAKEPRERFTSAELFAAATQAALVEQSTPSPRSPAKASKAGASKPSKQRQAPAKKRQARASRPPSKRRQPASKRRKPASASPPPYKPQIEFVKKESTHYVIAVALRHKLTIVTLKWGVIDKAFVDNQQVWKGQFPRGEDVLSIVLVDEPSEVWTLQLTLDLGPFGGLKGARAQVFSGNLLG